MNNLIISSVYSDDRFSVQSVGEKFKFMRECNYSTKNSAESQYYEVAEEKIFSSQDESEHYLKMQLIDWVASLFNDGEDLEDMIIKREE
jgi:hypothetical protein